MRLDRNVIEANHGELKRLIKPTLGFKNMKSAYATLKGFEVMGMGSVAKTGCLWPAAVFKFNAHTGRGRDDGFQMAPFRRGHHPPWRALVLQIRISYRDLEEMMAERGVQVDHTTLYRCVQRYAPMMEKRIRRYQGYTGLSWRVDETYIKVASDWAYLYRALDSDGDRTVEKGPGVEVLAQATRAGTGDVGSRHVKIQQLLQAKF